MTAKEYLGKIKTEGKQIARGIEEINSLYAMATGLKAIQYDEDRVQTSPKDSMSEIMSDIIDKTNKLDKEILAHIAFRNVVIQQISELPSNQADILYKRFIELKKFRVIQKETNYSERQVFKLYNAGLNEFYERFLKECSKVQ